MNDLPIITLPNLLGSTVSPLELGWELVAITTCLFTWRIYRKAKAAHARVMDDKRVDYYKHRAVDHALSCVYVSFGIQAFALVLGSLACIAPNLNAEISTSAIIPIICIMGMEVLLMLDSIGHYRYIEDMEQ